MYQAEIWLSKCWHPRSRLPSRPAQTCMHCAERKEIPGMLDNRLLLLACVYRCDHVVLPSSRPGGCIVITIRGTAGAEICISHADAAAWCVGAAACLHRMSSMGEQKFVSHAPRSAGRPLTGDFALQALETTYLPLCSKQCSEQRGTRSPVVVPIGTSHLTEQGCRLQSTRPLHGLWINSATNEEGRQSPNN